VLPEGHDTGFKVNNSYACHGTKKIDKKKVPLVVSDHRNIKWYSCGPTVYNSCHIGHASTYLRFDLVRRILSNLYGYKIFVVMGITDVDDKIVARSNLLRQDFSELSKKYEQEFIQNLKQLNISTPHTFVKVSNVIPEIISFIDKLLKNKQAYSTPNGNVWFDHKCLSEDSAFLVHTFDEYDESEFFGGDKKSPRDFALWKAAKDGEPYWQAPWGNGRPGWHIECSTITSLYFGGKLDIHTGAKDLIFPHHECEIFQCNAFHNTKQWCNYFLHSGLLKLNFQKTKMSKSLGNVVTIKDYLDEHPADLLRMVCMMNNWTEDVTYNNKALKVATHRLNDARRFLYRLQQYIHGNMTLRMDSKLILDRFERCKRQVDEACRDNFDTETIVRSVQELLMAVNQEMGREVEWDHEYEEPVGDRDNYAAQEILLWLTDLFEGLGFTTLQANRFESQL